MPNTEWAEALHDAGNVFIVCCHFYWNPIVPTDSENPNFLLQYIHFWLCYLFFLFLNSFFNLLHTHSGNFLCYTHNINKMRVLLMVSQDPLSLMQSQCFKQNHIITYRHKRTKHMHMHRHTTSFSHFIKHTARLFAMCREKKNESVSSILHSHFHIISQKLTKLAIQISFDHCALCTVHTFFEFEFPKLFLAFWSPSVFVITQNAEQFYCFLIHCRHCSSIFRDMPVHVRYRCGFSTICR